MKTNPAKAVRKGLLLALLASAVSMTGISRAQTTININFTGFTGGNPGPAAETDPLSGPAGGLGTTWNQYNANSTSGTVLDSGGAATTVQVSTNFSEGRYDGTAPALPVYRATLTDFSRGLDNKTVTITGLQASGLYDIWLMSLRSQSPDAERVVGWWSTGNTTTSASDQLIDSRGVVLNNSTFVAVQNFVLFENVEADGSGQIVFSGVAGTLLDGTDNAYRHGLNALQVKTAGPSGPADAGLSTVAASPAIVDADGTSTSTVTVTLRDATGKVAAGKDVTLAGDSAGAISPAFATTDASGQAAFAVSSSTVGVEEFTATDTTDSVVITQTTSVEFVLVDVVDADVSTVEASPGEVLADGTTTSTVTVTLKSSAGSPIAGKSVTVAGDGTAGISPSGAQTTNASGQVTFAVSSSTPGLETFTATDVSDSLTITQTASVDFLPVAVDAGVSKVEASPTSVPADGTTESTVTVTLTDSGGYPFEGKDVTLAGDGSADILPAGAQTTDAFGQVVFAVASATPGTEVFTATDVTDSLTITQTASVEFLAAGDVDAGTSTVEASPAVALADGSSTATITVTLQDDIGILIEGEDVTLAGSLGNAVITPASVTTDANGEAAFAVSSGTIGVEVFTATVVTSGNLEITQTASVEFLDPDVPLLINVNFNGFTGGNPGPEQDESTLEGPAGGLGTEWNQFAAPDSSGTLVDSNGVATAVAVDTNFSEGRYDGTGAPLTMFRATLTDFNRGFDNKNVTITGLDAGGLYDVWLVSFRNQSTDAERIVGWWSTGNTTTSASDQLIDTRGGALNNSTFVEGYNFVLFEKVKADETGQIVFNGVAGTLLDGSDNAYRHGLNGLQLQETVAVADIEVTITPNATNPGNYDFSWEKTSNNKVYDLVSNTVLTTNPMTWQVWQGHENMEGTAPENTLLNVPGGSNPTRFFAVIEKDPPPLFEEYFDAAAALPTDWLSNGPGGSGTDTDWDVEDPTTGFGTGPINGASSGSNCAGTNVLANGGQYGPDVVDLKLTSPSIPIPVGSGAILNFAQFIDTDGVADFGSVRILDADNADTPIAELEILNIEGDGTDADWTDETLEMEAAKVGGKNIKVEFGFSSDNSSEWGGFYIDDVKVYELAP